MRRTTQLPPDWKRRIETSIRNGESPFYKTPSAELDEHLRKELGDARLQNDMLRILRKEVVDSAAEYLWNATRARLPVQNKVPVYIHRALYWLANNIRPGPKERSTMEVRRIIWALEEVRDDTYVLKILRWKCENIKDLLESAIEIYRMEELSARRTKPKETGQRIALASLRHEFRIYFGNPMNQAVAYFMEAAFGGSWNAETVRTRASEWRC